MNAAPITSATCARTTGRRRHRWLLVALLLTACGPPPPVVTAPRGRTIYTIPPDVPETDVLCVVIAGPPFDPSTVGVHCLTVHDLRAWFAAQRRAD